MPVNIGGGSFQSFLLAFAPLGAFGPADVAFGFVCVNAPQATLISGVDTVLLSASLTPGPDVVALAATPNNNDGIVNVPGNTGTGVFAAATVDVGATRRLLRRQTRAAAVLQ